MQTVNNNLSKLTISPVFILKDDYLKFDETGIPANEYNITIDLGYSMVSDHNTWYYYAKKTGITHWHND